MIQNTEKTLNRLLTQTVTDPHYINYLYMTLDHRIDIVGQGCRIARICGLGEFARYKSPLLLLLLLLSPIGRLCDAADSQKLGYIADAFLPYRLT